jgi:hypothetical protein
VVISALLSEAGDDAVRAAADGRFRLPEEWRFLALAAAGQAEAQEVVGRLAAGTQDRDAALRVAAARLNAPGAWPAGRVSAFAGDDDSPLGQWRTICLGPRTGGAPRMALVDTTTLFTALRLVDADNSTLATPLTVLDLMSFLDAACLYDRLCFLENPHLTLAELESVFGPGLFVELPVESTARPGSDYAALGDIRGHLRSLYKSRTVPWINDVRAGRLGTRKQRKAWVRAWTVILRRDCSPQWLLRDPDEGQSSDYHDVWNSPATMLFDDIVAVMTEQLARADRGIAPTDQSGRARLGQESNARALFNAGLAQLLDVPYAASTARYPILNLLIAQTRGELAELLRTRPGAHALNEAFGDSVADMAGARPDALRLPFFPSAIVSRAERPAHLPEQLARVRDRSAAFRAHLAEMDAHLNLGDRAGRDAKAALRAALADTSRWDQLIPVAEVAAATGDAVLAWSDPSMHLLAVTVALLDGIVATGTIRAILARNRPKYRILRRLAPMASSAPSVGRLWAIGDIGQFAERMAELSALTTPPA